MRFVAAWCGLRHGTAHEALRALIREGIICEVERRGRLSFYVPGPMPEEAESEARETDEDALIIEAFDADELPARSTDDEAAR